MFSSVGLIGLAIFLAFIGILVACIYVFVLGIAGIPGALLTKALSKTNDGELTLSILGLFLTVAGQTYASLAFVVLIVLSVRSWTGEAQGIGKWILWPVAFCVSIAPILMALKDSAAKWRENFIGLSPSAIAHYEATTFTVPLTIIGFFIFAFFPRLTLWGWGWIPHF
jgi:hypothetical protein